MYPHSTLWHYLWIAPHAIQVFIVIAIIRRRLVSEFPIFLAYTGFQVILGAALFVLDHDPATSPQQYWTIHWGFLAISILLRFAVIYEIFANVFRQYGALARLSRILLKWSGALLLLVAVLVTAYAPVSDEPRIASAVHVVELGVNIIQSGLVLFLFMFSSYFKVSWKSYVFGIAAGIGLFSIVNLARQTIGITTGLAAGTYVLDFVTMAAYHCSVVIWLAYFLLPESQGRVIPSMPNQDLEEWNHELRRLLLQ